jgi:hypothetical protein
VRQEPKTLPHHSSLQCLHFRGEAIAAAGCTSPPVRGDHVTQYTPPCPSSCPLRVGFDHAHQISTTPASLPCHTSPYLFLCMYAVLDTALDVTFRRAPGRQTRRLDDHAFSCSNRTEATLQKLSLTCSDTPPPPPVANGEAVARAPPAQLSVHRTPAS